MRRRALGVLLLGTAAFFLFRARHTDSSSAGTPGVPSPPASSASALPSAGAVGQAPVSDPAIDPGDSASRPLKLPAGNPPALSCIEARRVVAQVRGRLAMPAVSPGAREFADHTADWLDPHGLWSAAPDSPIKHSLEQHALGLLAELEADPHSQSECDAAAAVARVVRDWVAEIGRELDTGRKSAPRVSRERVFLLAEASVFQDDPVTRPARALARELGARIGSFAFEFADAGAAVDAARSRLAPELPLAEWTGAVLAAAVRSYVPAVDPHGEWAPIDEEWSLYSADPGLLSEARLWGRMARTALGVRVLDEATPPLADGDLVLSVAGVSTAGLSVEQVEQLSHLESIGGETTRDVVVLRRSQPKPVKLSVELTREAPAEGNRLSVRRVSYGGDAVAVVAIPDVPDELGEDLEQVTTELAEQGEPLAGMVLDLRGNGGGSIDGAVAAIGLLLPGAPLFPLRHRDGTIEIQRATTPPPAHTWHAPVAALVDGYTASAAEMIAGAIAGYHRGPVIGSRTFGKGCVQEYFDDVAGAGVLRLTTMLFSLPDGSPLQGVGLSPTFSLPLLPASERERAIVGSLKPWQGPDVRAKASMGGAEWPAHRGQVGVNDDPVLRSALVRLGRAAPIRRTAAVSAGRPLRRSNTP